MDTVFNYNIGYSGTTLYCYDSAQITIKPPEKMTIDSSLSLFNGYNISCWDSTNGSISIVNVNGGIPQFAYSWRDSTDHKNINDTTNEIHNLHAGIYSLKISYSKTRIVIRTGISTL